MKSDLKINILLGLFAGLLVGVNLLGGKITSIFGISVSVGIFIMPVCFLITDIIEEVHGRKLANHFIIAGAVTLIIIFLYTALFVVLAPHQRYGFNQEYKTIFGASLRMILASLAAFILSQTHDVWAFAFWKKKTKGKQLWLRNNLSTIVSQFIDTSVFMFIAFYNIAPKFTFWFIVQLIVPYYLFKVLFALLDTPFVYLGSKWLKGKDYD